VHVRYFLYALDHDAEAQRFTPDGKMKTICYYSFSLMFYEYSMFIIYLDDLLPEASATHLIGSKPINHLRPGRPKTLSNTNAFKPEVTKSRLRKVCIKLEMPTLVNEYADVA
jgi:hypothetical protein